MIRVDFSLGWHIVCTSADPVAGLAVAELGSTLQGITGREVPAEMERSEGKPALVLSHGDGEQDGFRWEARPDADGGDEYIPDIRSIELQGHNPRGLLYAVYSLLEALGCRWVAPGTGGERIPRGVRFDLPEEPVADEYIRVETPALPGRCLIIGHYAFMQEVEEWIVWAARNRLNTIFLHVIEGPLALGAAPERQWQQHKGMAVALARQRGMTIEHGGHGLAGLLPRRLFKRMPGAFRYHDGRRRPDHNFCPTCAEGLAVIQKNAEAHFRAHPEVDVFHVWPDDIAGGGWCECERCREYTPAEQGLLAINAIAEALEGVNPAAQVAFLAYHDTEDVPAKVRPRPNVCVSWAPRKRCYAHATDDGACAVNVPRYAETFRAQAEHFRAAGAQPPRVFEYYLDGILFKSLLPPLATVMQRDLRFYRDAGAHTVQALMTGDRPWTAPQLNVWLFARLAWNPDQDLDRLLADFSRATFGSESADLPAYYRALKAAFQLALDVVPEQIKIEFELGLLELMNNPPADMGDPAFAPPEVLRRKSQANAGIADLVEEAARHLEAARPAAEPQAWEAERAEFDLARAWLGFDLSRVRLYDAIASRPVPPEARQHLDDAQAALDEALAWGEAHIEDARFRRNFSGIHRVFWQGRLNAIRANYFAGRWGAWMLRGRMLLQIAGVFWRLRGLYREDKGGEGHG